MIPVNIITGVLGVGKTTAVRHLLSLRPPEERWGSLSPDKRENAGSPELGSTEVR